MLSQCIRWDRSRDLKLPTIWSHHSIHWIMLIPKTYPQISLVKYVRENYFIIITDFLLCCCLSSWKLSYWCGRGGLKKTTRVWRTLVFVRILYEIVISLSRYHKLWIYKEQKVPLTEYKLQGAWYVAWKFDYLVGIFYVSFFL